MLYVRTRLMFSKYEQDTTKERFTLSTLLEKTLVPWEKGVRRHIIIIMINIIVVQYPIQFSGPLRNTNLLQNY